LRSKVKVNGNENVKIFLRISSSKWIDLYQSKTKMILRPFYTVKYIMVSGHDSCCILKIVLAKLFGRLIVLQVYYMIGNKLEVVAKSFPLEGSEVFDSSLL